MKKKGWDRDVVIVFITTLVTLACWVGFEVYRAYLKTDLPQGVEKHLKTLDPQLKTGVLDRLRQMNR